jgi:hypothetical protein
VPERSPGGASVSRISLVAAGVALFGVGFLCGRHLARRRMAVVPLRSAPAPAEPVAPPNPPAPFPPAVEDAGPGSIMTSELERLAGVAVSHGPDDPALDVFLAFVGVLDPVPDADTLKPAAQRIGSLRLTQALDRPGDPSLGASRLLAAVSPAPPRVEGDRLSRTVTVERPVEAGRRLPELFEALLHAIRVGLGLLASR